ncbi:MAG: adenylylsulfate reductase, partial [Hyphomonadaceae bacterium]|nr:adenylylsulfate reductase [Clostridia bacterium]
AMQKTMDEYAGGIATGYAYNNDKLKIASKRIVEIQQLVNDLNANDTHELMLIYELVDRLVVCQAVIAHLAARKETRWHAFQENADCPERDDENWQKYVNSRYVNGKIEIIYRDLVGRDEQYEHPHA